MNAHSMLGTSCSRGSRPGIQELGGAPGPWSLTHTHASCTQKKINYSYHVYFYIFGNWQVSKHNLYFLLATLDLAPEKLMTAVMVKDCSFVRNCMMWHWIPLRKDINMFISLLGWSRIFRQTLNESHAPQICALKGAHFLVACAANATRLAGAAVGAVREVRETDGKAVSFNPDHKEKKLSACRK